MPQPQEGLLRVVTPDELTQAEEQQNVQPDQPLEPVPGLLSFLDNKWRIMRNYRSSEAINWRLQAAS